MKCLEITHNFIHQMQITCSDVLFNCGKLLHFLTSSFNHIYIYSSVIFILYLVASFKGSDRMAFREIVVLKNVLVKVSEKQLRRSWLLNALVKTFFKVRGRFMGNIIPVRGTKVRGRVEKDILERQVSSLLTLNKLCRTFSLLSYCFVFFSF